MKTHTVLAIGAHVGDAELTAGALLATWRRTRRARPSPWP